MTVSVRVRLADVGQHTQGGKGTIIKKGVTPRGHHPARPDDPGIKLSQFLDCPIESGNDRHGVGRAMTGGVRVRLADVGQHTQGCNDS